MRIAICGSHRTGKSTLVATLAELLPAYQVVEEPYRSMEEGGHEFAQPPSLEDFVAQLERSVADVNESGPDVIFDRCPIDLLGYILSHEDAESFDLEEALPAVEEAVRSLDLVVFIPIEFPDRITFPQSDDEGAWREAVDEKIRDLLLDDPYDLDLNVLQAEGDVKSRAERVLRALRGKSH